MIDINTYRSRIGNFVPMNICRKTRQEFAGDIGRSRSCRISFLLQLLLLVSLSSAMLATSFIVVEYTPLTTPVYETHYHNSNSDFLVLLDTSYLVKEYTPLSTPRCFKCCHNPNSIGLNKDMEENNKIIIDDSSKKPNFVAKIVNGNIQRGLFSIHLNIRSLYNKMSDVKNFVKLNKPHILGISETELKKSHHSVNSLKIPGYDLVLPKSWDIHGKARVVIFIKNSLEYEHLPDLEQPDIQSIWVRAGFKNSKKIYFSHQYREHTNSMGNSMAAQREALDKMLKQWENALVHGNPDTPNEVHIAGDMNLDSSGGRWLQADYPLVTLGRMVRDSCNLNNFSQLVDKVTRVQFNQVTKQTATSCIDHVYSNAKHRISTIKVISSGTSDHDAISFTRFSKNPAPPTRTIRKRSYKNFKEDEYLRDISSLDFTDVYTTNDVNEAADLLTEKLVQVLNKHAPWIIFQQRKNFAPWVTAETLELMKQRDRLKEEAKVMASNDGIQASAEQVELWDKYKKVRNKVNNRNKQEEINYKRSKVKECENNPSKTWGLAKKFMEWSSPGPPTQLEVEEGKKVILYRKARDLARIMNNFFISKVQKIVESLPILPRDLSGCKKLMKDKKTSFSARFVSVNKIRKLLGCLKVKTCSSVDQLDNYAVKLAADYVAGPLHHVVTLSLMQQRFPQSWKYTKIIPLHKKKSTLQRENYRPVAILSPLSKVLEKVVYEQIYSYFDGNKLFHPSLHGYRKGGSTMTALLSMYEKWVKAASTGQLSGVVLVDLSAAFDLVSPELLIKKLEIYGVDEATRQWILSYLTDRYQSVWIDHVFSDFIENSIGVPQGSNLGPLFFLIFFNDLPTFITGNIDCYADDSTLGATAKDVADIGTRLSTDCDQLSRWMKSNSFKLNADKTHFLVMGTNRRLNSMKEKMEVRMDDMGLTENKDSSVELLGVKVQGNLEWSSQVGSLATKLKKRLSGLEKLRYVMNKSNKKSIVEGIFNSVLCYCLPLFGGCNEGDISVLQVLQNRAAHIVAKMPPRTSRQVLFNKLGWLTVLQLIAYHTLVSVFKTRLSGEPEDLAITLSRDNNTGHIIMKNVVLGLYRKSFIFRGALLWNRLPSNIRKEIKIAKFKKAVKVWVAENVDRF